MGIISLLLAATACLGQTFNLTTDELNSWNTLQALGTQLAYKECAGDIKIAFDYASNIYAFQRLSPEVWNTVCNSIVYLCYAIHSRSRWRCTRSKSL